jgi:hypothetical protein
MTWSNDPKENNTLVRTYSLFEIEYCLSLYRAQNALDVEYGTNSTYLHAHMPKINSSYVKICESSQKSSGPVLVHLSPKILDCYRRRSIVVCEQLIVCVQYI